jgi:hypothetical protein
VGGQPGKGHLAESLAGGKDIAIKLLAMYKHNAMFIDKQIANSKRDPFLLQTPLFSLYLTLTQATQLRAISRLPAR